MPDPIDASTSKRFGLDSLIVLTSKQFIDFRSMCSYFRKSKAN